MNGIDLVNELNEAFRIKGLASKNVTVLTERGISNILGIRWCDECDEFHIDIFNSRKESKP